jgi:HD-GYP domain-containing protein (c-di-GMP phosphodiesterase class II)
MKSKDSELISISELRVGLYIELDLGWMSHPFPTGSFKITSPRQLEIIRGLGLKQVRWDPTKSDPPEEDSSSQSGFSNSEAARQLDVEREQALRRADLHDRQQKSLRQCERKFNVAQQLYARVQEVVVEHPMQVRDDCVNMVAQITQEMNCDGEVAIRLLSEGVGERASMHSVNVAVMCLLLGRSMSLDSKSLMDLGVAAFLHDIGKLHLPSRVKHYDEKFSQEDYFLYQEHVARSASIVARMQLGEGVLAAVSQHHEMVDGSGFPHRPSAELLTMPAKILALVNRYDNLCNPHRASAAMTPHEALSLLFAMHKQRFDNVVLSAFIRMMGVYPPGSVVQLIDGRYALVVSVNSIRPLKPRVIVFDANVPKHEALILDLEQLPNVAIRRSLKPANLPPDAMDYLAPRQRIAYYFESSGPSPLDTQSGA